MVDILFDIISRPAKNTNATKPKPTKELLLNAFRTFQDPKMRYLIPYIFHAGLASASGFGFFTKFLELRHIPIFMGIYSVSLGLGGYVYGIIRIKQTHWILGKLYDKFKWKPLVIANWIGWTAFVLAYLAHYFNIYYLFFVAGFILGQHDSSLSNLNQSTIMELFADNPYGGFSGKTLIYLRTDL